MIEGSCPQDLCQGLSGDGADSSKLPVSKGAATTQPQALCLCGNEGLV